MSLPRKKVWSLPRSKWKAVYVLTIYTYYYGYQIEVMKMGGTCNMHWVVRIKYRIVVVVT